MRYTIQFFILVDTPPENNVSPLKKKFFRKEYSRDFVALLKVNSAWLLDRYQTTLLMLIVALLIVVVVFYLQLSNAFFDDRCIFSCNKQLSFGAPR